MQTGGNGRRGGNVIEVVVSLGGRVVDGRNIVVVTLGWERWVGTLGWER